MTSNLPESKKEWEKIKTTFKKKGIEDTPEAWTFVLSQLQNTKMPELKFSYENVIAHFKRFKIAKVLQDEKTVYLMELQRKAEEKIKALTEEMGKDEGISPSEHTEHMQDGTHHSEGELPPLPDSEEGVVQYSRERRF